MSKRDNTKYKSLLCVFGLLFLAFALSFEPSDKVEVEPDAIVEFVPYDPEDIVGSILERMKIDDEIEAELNRLKKRRVYEARMMQKISDHIHIDYRRSKAKAWVYAPVVLEASERYNVPVEIILAVIEVESDYRHHVRSFADAQGSMQVIGSVWEGVTEYDVSDFKENIMLGTFIIDRYRNRLGSYTKALKAYNVGITTYRKGTNRGAEKRYITKINTALKRIGYKL